MNTSRRRTVASNHASATVAWLPLTFERMQLVVLLVSQRDGLEVRSAIQAYWSKACILTKTTGTTVQDCVAYAPSVSGWTDLELDIQTSGW